MLGISGDEREKMARALKGAAIVESAEQADLTWDGLSHEVLDRIGKIASGITAEGLQAVIDRTKALESVRDMIAKSGFDMKLVLPGESGAAPPSIASDRPHRRGTRLKLVATGLRNPYFVLFNIAGDGTVQFLYPLRNDSPTVPTTTPWLFDDIYVQPPFGADHAIGIAGGQPLSELVAALGRLHGKKEPTAAVAAVERQTGVGDAQVGMQGIFTTDA
jgi:hypothetical protein